MYAPESRKSSTAPKRHSNFARDDISAEQLAQKRKRVMWQGVILFDGWHNG